ncbi:MAG: MipA/OmpV family protein [Rhizobacter sp.]|nr:MipA/OmpV family protein [Bacteriovorax sp.]
MKFSLALCFLILPSILYAKTLHLLDIPLNDGSKFSYVVNTKEKCSFKDVVEIETPKLDEKPKTISGKIDKLQREINLDVDDLMITSELISFTLTGASNVELEFYFDAKDCDLIRVMKIDKKKYHVKSIDAEYIDTFKTPVLKKMTFHAEERDVVLYPWALHDNVAIYELQAGAGFEVHSNIRLKDQTAFHKTDPSYGPVGVFSFRYGPFFINRDGVGSLLYTHDNFTILGIGLLEGENYKGENLKERKLGLFLGTLINYDFVNFTFYNDFIDHEKGLVLKLAVAPKFYYKTAWMFKPQLAAQYWSDKYVDYYYGITPAETMASGLRTYNGKHTLNYAANVEIQHYIGKWTIVSELAAKFFGKEVYTSPTVTKKSEIKFTSGIVYKFL